MYPHVFGLPLLSSAPYFLDQPSHLFQASLCVCVSAHIIQHPWEQGRQTGVRAPVLSSSPCSSRDSLPARVSRETLSCPSHPYSHLLPSKAS